jgi:hypothetical protein
MAKTDVGSYEHGKGWVLEDNAGWAAQWANLLWLDFRPNFWEWFLTRARFGLA